MALYVQVDLTFFTSKKVIKGARILGITPIQFGGHMIALWAWSMTNAKDGVLDDLEPQDIATAAGYPEDAEKFLKTIIAVGFVDSGENLTLHNWQERSGKILELQEKDRIRAKEKYTKKTGESTENPRITTGESEILGSLTKLNLTKLNLTYSEEESTSFSDETDSPAIPKADKKSIGPKIPENVQRIIDLWNTHKPINLTKVRAIDAARLRKIKARLAQFPDDSDWIDAIKNIADSEFYSGKSGKGYKASFDFLLQENGLKAFEGPLEAEKFDPKRKLKNNCQTNDAVDYASEEGVIKC